MAERPSLSSSWGGSEPMDLGQTKGSEKGGPGRGTLAWEAGGSQKLDSEEGPLSLLSPCSLSHVLLDRGEQISLDGEGGWRRS